MKEKSYNLSGIGARLKTIRKSLKRTLKEMSQLSGLSTSTLHEMETGINKPNTKYLFLLNREFNVNLNWVITGGGNPFLPALDLKFDFGKDTEKFFEMIYLIENSDRVRIELLLDYLKYREKNEDFINRFLEENKPEKR